jgi:hypothetical protein
MPYALSPKPLSFFFFEPERGSLHTQCHANMRVDLPADPKVYLEIARSSLTPPLIHTLASLFPSLPRTRAFSLSRSLALALSLY